MAWFRRRKDDSSGQVITPDGLPVLGKSAGPAFEDLVDLGAYLTSAGIRVVDPGVPLSAYADTATAHNVWATQPSVRKVVDYAARAGSTIPWHVYRRVSDTDRRRVTDDPLAQVMRRPGPRRSPSRLWHALWVDFLIYDRWCVQVLPNADTASGWELRRIPPRRVHFLADDYDEVAALHITSPRGDAEVVEDLSGYLFDHGYSTLGASGTSPMETLCQTLAEAREAVEYRRGVWRNSARVPAVIERPADAPEWSPTAKSRFSEAFNRFIGRAGQAGGTPILEDGMRLVPITAFNPRETGDIEGRQLTDAEVASSYHIPPELVGARAGTFSNVDAFRQMLYTHSLGPTVTQFQDVLNTMLVPLLDPTGALYVEANVEAKLRGSFTEQAALLQTAVGAPYMLRSEARAVQNLPYVEGTEELVTPLNVLVGGLASPRDTAPKALKPPPKAGGRLVLLKGGRPDDLGTFEVERDAYVDALTAWSQAQADRLLAAAGAKADGPPDFYELWAASSPERQAQLAALMQSYGFRLAQIGAWSVLDVWNPEADGWDAAVMEGWLAAAAKSRAEAHDQDAADTMAAAVREEGDWRDNLKSGMAAWVVASAVRARTAATEARGFGSHDAAGASGLVYKVWRTGGTSPRPSHVVLNGDKVPLGDVFGNGCRWPGDGSGDAKETANCNCRLDYERE